MKKIFSTIKYKILLKINILRHNEQKKIESKVFKWIQGVFHDLF